MLDHTPRVAAIHDLSGLGRCSLTVALPVLSVMGCQCAPMPTAVLSSQTGGVTGYTFLDMTDQMAPIAAHWKAVDARFDAIYTGFLGSEAQLSVVEKFFDDFAQTDTLLLVDPVMGMTARPTIPTARRSFRGCAIWPSGPISSPPTSPRPPFCWDCPATL